MKLPSANCCALGDSGGKTENTEQWPVSPKSQVHLNHATQAGHAYSTQRIVSLLNRKAGALPLPNVINTE